MPLGKGKNKNDFQFQPNSFMKELIRTRFEWNKTAFIHGQENLPSIRLIAIIWLTFISRANSTS